MTVIVPGRPQRPVVVEVEEGGAVEVVAQVRRTLWGQILGALNDQLDLVAALGAKQDTLVSGVNIKTLNGSTILGSGDIIVSGGSGVWGGITGTLSAQTDLQTALNGKQPLATVLTNTTASFTTAQETKLAGIATGATANQTDTFLLSRANHTGTQAAETITGLATVATSGSAADLGTGTLPAARLPAFGSGDVLFAASGGAGAIAADAVTNTKLANMATSTLKGRVTAGTGDPEDLSVAQAKTLLNLAGTNSGDQTITLTGDVTGSGTGSFAATVANDAITNAKLANVATATIKGRATAGTGDPEDLTGTQATALLDAFTSGAKGLAPASGGGTTNFLRADGTWAAPGGGGATNLAWNAATSTVTSDTGTDATLTVVNSTQAGLAPASGGGTTNFLRADGTWAAPSGGGGGFDYGINAAMSGMTLY